MTCSAADGTNLKCSFPENITAAQKDFSLYFYPDNGSEGMYFKFEIVLAASKDLGDIFSNNAVSYYYFIL